MIGDIKHFRFWCQKVLPLVYDNSLSYYEVLCKVVQYLNGLIDDINKIPEYIDSKIEEALDDEHILELLSQFIVKIQSAISANNEGTNVNSSKDYNVGQMLWLNDTLYKVIRPISAGATFIVDTNIEAVDFETLFNDFVDEVKHDITANDDGSNATASQSWTAGTWLWLNDILYIVKADIAEGNAYVFTGDNANVEQITVEGELAKEANARTSADSALQNEIGDLIELNTTNKLNVVSAINEVLSKTNSLNIYNIADYDIADDGTDQYAKFIDLMAIVDANGGGIIYVPKGRYITSNTIPIPSNTIIFGDGIESEIYFDGTDPYMGTTIMPAGDNILVTNLSLEYYEADKTIIKLGTQLGAIGITNRRFVANQDAKNFQNGAIKNITFDRIFSTNTHPYNIEPETTANIDNCTLSNCNFENGEIYINPLSPADSIHNAKVHDCSSKGIVIGSGYNTNGSIFICNCYTHYARFTDINITIDNLQLDALSYIRGTGTPSYSMQINGDNIILNNVRIVNNGEDIANGVVLTSSAGNNNVFNNVYISGYTENYYDNVGKFVRFTNCNFGDAELSHISGVIRNSNIKVAQNTDCNVDYTRVGTITLSTNLAYNGNSDIITSHEGVISINGIIDSSKTLVETSLIGNVPAIYKPSATRYMVALFAHSGAYYPMILEVTSNGALLVNKLFGQNVASGDTLYIDSEYML